MGDRQKKKKCANPTEDLDRYIDEVKSEGDVLDETLQRLIFSPGGSSVMEDVGRKDKKRKDERKGEDGYDDDFSDALEFIKEDLQKYRGSNNDHEEDDLYQDAQSHFDPSSSSISSPYSVVSPSVRGFIDPLSPNTSFAVDKMSRVSLYSPAAGPSSGYYAMNGQGVPSVSRPSSIAPSHSSHPPSVNPSHSSHPPSIPPSHVSLHPHLPPTLPIPPPSHLHHTIVHQPIHPNGSYHPNGPQPVPYPPQMAPSPYHPQSMPLPPSVPIVGGPSMNGHSMASTSSINPLFSPYSHPPPSNHPYSMHPHSSPYPPMPYHSPVPSVHQRATVQAQQDQLARQLAQQQQMTARMISQCNNQMHIPPSHQQRQSQSSTIPRPSHISPNAPSTSKHRSYNLPSTSTHLSPNVPSASKLPSSNIPSTSKSSSTAKTFDISRLNPEQLELYKREYDRQMAEWKNEIKKSEEERETISREPRLRKKKKKMIPTKPISQMTVQELEEARKKAKNEQFKMQLLEKFGEYREDEEGNVLPVEKPGRVITWKGDKRFPLPEGKDMSFYIKPPPEPKPPLSVCPSPAQKELEYIAQVPPCTEGKEKPMLSRGHDNTEERKKHTNLYGKEYVKQIQHVFHSLTGDPSRVPNASTNGEKWEHIYKEGEEPTGMEVYRDVRGRVWNADYDYSLIFKQLKEIGVRLNGYKYAHKPRRRKEEKKDDKENKARREVPTLTDEVPERGNVFVSYADAKQMKAEWESDGRIAVGGVALKIEEEKREEARKKKEEEEKKEKEENEEKKEEEYKRFIRDSTKKMANGYYPTLMANRFWAKIAYYEKVYEVGIPFYCKWNMPKVFVDTFKGKGDEPNRYCLAKYDREDREPNVIKLLAANDSTIYIKTTPGGYIILGSISSDPIFVQSPIYNAVMGEELDTIVRIEKGHEMIIFDENFFNLLLQQAHQFGENVVFDTKQLLHTRVSFTKGWGEAYPKPTILDALVWIEISLLNAMRKIDTLLRMYN